MRRSCDAAFHKFYVSPDVVAAAVMTVCDVLLSFWIYAVSEHLHSVSHPSDRLTGAALGYDCPMR